MSDAAAPDEATDSDEAGGVTPAQSEPTSATGPAGSARDPAEPVDPADDAVRAAESTTSAGPSAGDGQSAESPSSTLDATPTIDPAAVARLARLHLTVGMYTLARAELEALRVLASLDDDGLEALAEARWRTGDLAAAGTVAVPLAQAGSDRPLVLVLAAEAVAAQGRPGEASRFASRAMEAIDVPLDTLFAGLPRRASWPVVTPPDGARIDPAEPPAVATSGAASSAAAEAYAGGRAALAAGDAARAALEMGVALRLDPGFATEVLDVIGTRATEPGLVLVAGDALRILGREQEALNAFDIARGAAALVADSAAADARAHSPASVDADAEPVDASLGDEGDARIVDA